MHFTVFTTHMITCKSYSRHFIYLFTFFTDLVEFTSGWVRLFLEIRIISWYIWMHLHYLLHAFWLITGRRDKDIEGPETFEQTSFVVWALFKRKDISFGHSIEFVENYRYKFRLLLELWLNKDRGKKVYPKIALWLVWM